ncbi:hypothetical protein EDB81DRAFT_846434 [Dactylonectria macrodidyma]|uniref:Uncharacterized protein n=1 Tax=Dactylonectria macrodidyma TaxID=307937 RepID=A0A9P9DYY4_9HYPO|nr:hypothetical protein EDB81DRAFT_846434 [Dactylonectria macrodidyma]
MVYGSIKTTQPNPPSSAASTPAPLAVPSMATTQRPMGLSQAIITPRPSTITGKAYRAVLDSVDAVVGAVEWVFSTIETGIEDLIQFLEFLFGWDDIARTKDVLYNVTKQWMSSQVDSIQMAKTAFDDQIANAEKSINQWAGITDWSTSLGQVASQPASASDSNPTAGQTSGSQMLLSHYKNNGADLTIMGTPPSGDVVQQDVDDLLNTLEQEGQVLSAVYSQLQTLATNFFSMTIGQALKQLAGTIADGVLSSVQVVVDAVFKLLTDLASAAVSLIETKIHIPIISDILNAIGISAVSYTVVYRIANNRAPFPDNADVQSLIDANSWGTLSIYPVAPETAKGLYEGGHIIASCISIMAVFFDAREAESPSGDNPWSISSAAIAVVGGASNGIANLAFSQDPVQNTGLKILSYINTAATVITKLIFSGWVQALIKATNPDSGFAFGDGRTVGAKVDVCLVISAATVTIRHFSELGSDEADATKKRLLWAKWLI